MTRTFSLPELPTCVNACWPEAATESQSRRRTAGRDTRYPTPMNTTSTSHGIECIDAPFVLSQPEDAHKKPDPKRPKSMAGLREEGLARPVGGLGLALLQKMGYKEGTGLGASGTGIAEPLAVEMRDHRSGLGAFEVRWQRKRVEGRLVGRLC